jgi:hypothetical protein
MSAFGVLARMPLVEDRLGHRLAQLSRRLADAEWLENARLIGIRSDTAPKNAVPRNGWTVRRILKTRAAADE